MTAPPVRNQRTTNYKYPAIPAPGETIEELRATVRALKEAVDVLTGRSHGRAVSLDQLGRVVGVSPDILVPTDPTQPGKSGGDDWIPDALERYNDIFDVSLQEVRNTFNETVGEATLELQELIEQGDINVKTEVGGLITDVDNKVITAEGRLAGIDDAIVLLVDEDGVLAGSIETVKGIAEGAASAVSTLEGVVAKEDEALGFRIDDVQAIAYKKRVFIQPTEPIVTLPEVLVLGDLWIDTSAAGRSRIKVWEGNLVRWTDATDKRLTIAFSSLTDVNFAYATGEGSVGGQKAMAYRMNTISSIVGVDSNRAEGFLKNEEFTNIGPNTSVVGRLSQLNAVVGNNAAYVATSLGATVNEAGAIAGTATNIKTTLNGHTTTIDQMMMSVDGTRAAWHIRAVHDGRDGGGIAFTSVRNPDQTIQSTFKVDGDAVITGTLAANRLVANSIGTNQLSVGGTDIYALVDGAATFATLLADGPHNITMNGVETLVLDGQFFAGRMGFVSGGTTYPNVSSRVVFNAVFTFNGGDIGSYVSAGSHVWTCSLYVGAPQDTILHRRSTRILPSCISLGAAANTLSFQLVGSASVGWQGIFPPNPTFPSRVQCKITPPNIGGNIGRLESVVLTIIESRK